MNRTRVSLVFLLATAILAACAPAPSPAVSPTPSSAPVAAPRPAPASATRALTQQEIAWAKTIEAAKKEGRVTFYTFSFVGDIGLALTKAFEDQFGIKVDMITGRGAEFIERLKTEQRTGNQTADITEGSPTHLTNMKLSGITVALPDLPVLREKDTWKVHPNYLDPDGHVLSYTPTYMWGWINTKLVKPGEEPKSHMELLEPRWQGKVLVNDPRVSVGAYTTWLQFVNKGLLPKDYIERLGKNKPLMVTGGGMGLDKLVREEAPVYMAFPAFQGTLMVAQGAPIRPFDTAEGVTAQTLAHAVIKNSPHPNAARLLANWLLEKQGQEAYAQAILGDPIRTDVPQSYPASLRLTPKKPVWSTVADIDAGAKAMREQAWAPYFR